MTKVMLIAGVAALAIAAPAAAGPHGHGGGGGGPHGGGGGHGFAAPQQSHGGGPRMQAERGHGGGGFSAPRMQARSQHFNFPRERGRPSFAMQRQTAQRERGAQRQARAVQMRHSEQRQARPMQMRSQQRQAHAIERRNQMREAHAVQMHRQQQAQMAERRNAQQQVRMVQRQQQIRGDRQQQRAFADNRMAQRQRMQQMRELARDNRVNQRFAARQFVNTDFASRYGNGRGLRDACPPGLAAKNNGCMPPGQAMKLLGSPLSRAASYASLAALPESLRYMYPDTADRYYRYGDGYLYGVNRNTDVIDSLLPLVAGGYLPGMTLPASYMNSYVPDYYGMSSFYPDTAYADYRYMDGNVYSLDPYSGVIEDVIPTYAYGYGVGQMLPAGYGYYNVPYQYRQVYYDTPDYSYWYAPGAIYQVDPASQLITSVASLLGPGMVVGQPMPMGYATYNVPMAYRSTYYDTPNAWYRYNNGYIYQVDPTTQLVTAIVASLLT